MNPQKLIAFLLALCVLLAPVLGNAAFQLPATSSNTHDQSVPTEDCHSHAVNHADDDHGSSTKVNHNCCFNFVGNIPVTDLLQAGQNNGEIIPFNPSLSLAFRGEGLFRPPRQNS